MAAVELLAVLDVKESNRHKHLACVSVVSVNHLLVPAVPCCVLPLFAAGVMAKVIKSGVDMINHYSNASKGRSAAQLTAAVRSIFALDHAAASTRDGPVSVNWEALGQASSHLFRTVPGLGSMLGALESQAKVRKQVVRQKRAVLEPEVRPKDGSDALRQEHGLGQETERVVTDMRRVLERVGSCSLIALVLDHDSFAHTLENVFALSFLCK